MRGALFCLCVPILLAGAVVQGQKITRDGEMEKMVLCGVEGAKEWPAAESTLTPSRDRVKVGPASLHWHVTVDHLGGEKNYPIGWPRFSLAIPEGPLRDWSGWDFFHMWVYTDTSRPAPPRDPVGMGLYTPDKEGAFHTKLTDLKKGEWVEIAIPLIKIPRNNDVRAIQFSISESNYRDKDQLDLYIDDLCLERYAQPTLLDFGSENAVMFADATCVPISFRMAGVRPGGEAVVTCELRREGRVIAQKVSEAAPGPQRVALGLGGRTLTPGAYEISAQVAGGLRPATAQVRVVESPWK